MGYDASLSSFASIEIWLNPHIMQETKKKKKKKKKKKLEIEVNIGMLPSVFNKSHEVLILKHDRCINYSAPVYNS